MATLEQVEKLKERADVSYDEAKAALETCGDNLLDAMIYLEKQGKVRPPEHNGYYSTQQDAKGSFEQNYANHTPGGQKKENAKETCRRFGCWIRTWVHKGNTNSFQVWRDGKVILSVPVTVLVLLLVFCFWVSLPLLVVGLFLDCRYRFEGADISRIDVNKVMDSAAEAAEKVKNDIVN